jgi:hypothetical protein
MPAGEECKAIVGIFRLQGGLISHKPYSLNNLNSGRNLVQTAQDGGKHKTI